MIASEEPVQPIDLHPIILSEVDAQTSFRLLQDFVVPRPVFLLSTLSERGVPNVAPYSCVMPCSTWPPRLAICLFDKEDGSAKDTLLNIRSTGEVVVNMVNAELLVAANACGAALPRDSSEFEACGIASQQVTSVVPHVARSPARFECRMESETRMPGVDGGGGTIVIVKLVHAYVLASAYQGRGALDVEALSPIGRGSIDRYLPTDGLFAIKRPDTGEAGV